MKEFEVLFALFDKKYKTTVLSETQIEADKKN